MRSHKAWAALLLTVPISACGMGDPNEKPTYGPTGLPSNCRAYVQSVIDSQRAAIRKGDMRALNEAIDGLERNCGNNGHSWGRT